MDTKKKLTSGAQAEESYIKNRMFNNIFSKANKLLYFKITVIDASLLDLEFNFATGPN